jgi:hypothetical protein
MIKQKEVFWTIQKQTHNVQPKYDILFQWFYLLKKTHTLSRHTNTALVKDHFSHFVPNAK